MYPGQEQYPPPKKKWSTRKKLLVFVPITIVAVFAAFIGSLVVYFEWKYIVGYQTVADPDAGIEFHIGPDWVPFGTNLPMAGGQWRMFDYGTTSCSGPGGTANTDSADIIAGTYPATQDLKGLFDKIWPNLMTMTEGHDTQNAKVSTPVPVNVDGAQGIHVSVLSGYQGVPECYGNAPNTTTDFAKGDNYILFPSKDANGRDVTAVFMYSIPADEQIQGVKTITSAERDDIVNSIRRLNK